MHWVKGMCDVLLSVQVVDLCVHPNPLGRPTPAKLLSMSFLKVRVLALLPTLSWAAR